MVHVNKLIALMLVRNEAWCIEASLRQALKWADGVVVYLDRCTDDTFGIVADTLSEKVPETCSVRNDTDTASWWEEMDKRQWTLEEGRRLGGTHFAVIDADEVLTSNLLPIIRGWFFGLRPAELLEVPMYAVWDENYQYRQDRSVWSHARITLGFADDPKLRWAAREDGYQHHARPPRGSALGDGSNPIKRGEGGVFHLQFANKRRLHAKHVLYRMVDHIRWPGRRTPSELNRIYSEAESMRDFALAPSPKEWVEGLGGVNFDEAAPWQEGEIRNLLEKHGREAFAGLDLGGF